MPTNTTMDMSKKNMLTMYMLGNYFGEFFFIRKFIFIHKGYSCVYWRVMHQ